MKNFIRHSQIMMVLLFIVSTKLFSQQNTFSTKQAIDLVSKNATSLNLSAEDVKNLIVTDAYEDNFAQTKMVYIQQTYKSIPVYNVLKSLAFKKDKVVSATGRFIGKISYKVNVADGIPTVLPSDAVSAAAVHVHQPIRQGVQAIAIPGVGSKLDFGLLGIAKENITAQLLWVPDMGKLKLCWQVLFFPVNSSDCWLINVDALKGVVVSKDNLTVKDNWDKVAVNGSGTYKAPVQKLGSARSYSGLFSTEAISAKYRVIPYPAEDMDHPGGTPTLVSNPWEMAGAGNLATTLGWHNDSITIHDSTRGNNVWAREDRAANNGSPRPGAPAISSTPLPDLTFDFPFDAFSSPTAQNNQNFAITQLFYWNNIMHDISYQYGFDEAAGNFQFKNLGRGGRAGDYVIADAQDGSGTNNSNFSTLPDGTRPRMQMFLFDPSPYKTVYINSPAAMAGYRIALEGEFSPYNKLADVGPITANLALYDPAVNATNQACTALNGTPLAGKIALIDRGGCNFSVKVKNAQAAGALAVIVVNTDNSYLVMSGTDSSITIPAVLISKTDGDAMRGVLKNGQAVNLTLSQIQLDGSLDNGVMGHEYTHGISNRLTGGPANTSCLTNKEQMGEGWSDYYALMVTTNWATAKTTDGPNKRPLGNYVFGLPITGGGIRTYPYSTDTSINKWTYGQLANNTDIITSTDTIIGEVHLIGEIWAATLWDMTWNIIQMDGINTNLYNASGAGGNSVALKLVTEGLKLQTCRPGFLDGRDAILKADTILYNGKYSCAIWKAFARRGMGIHAVQGSSDDTKDQDEDYSVPGAIVKKSSNKVIASQNEQVTYSITANCQCAAISNFTIVDTLATNVTYVSGGAYNTSNRTVTFTVPSLSAAQSQSFNVTVKVNTGTYTAPQELLNETVASATFPAGWETATNGNGNWVVSSTRSHSPSNSFMAADKDSTSVQTLATAASYNINGISTLSFWNFYNTEATYDGGIVEISADNGITWTDAGPYFTQNGYNSVIGSGSQRGFSGTSGGQFIQSVLNLSAFNGKKIKIRFVFTSDEGKGGDGWYIDDIVLKNEAGVYNVAKLLNSNNQVQSVSDTVTMISNTLPLVWGDFTAQKQATVGLLKWTTMQEQNTEGFSVERSDDGVHFISIGTLRANGNSALPLSYQFTDVAPLNGLNYYRIRQIDKDGQFTYSEVRTLNFDGIASLITMTPNPAKDRIAITARGNKKTLQVTLFSAKGEKAGKFIISGEYTQLNLPKYAPGVYYVRIKGDNVDVTKKLVIE